jgi:hypothetical protein
MNNDPFYAVKMTSAAILSYLDVFASSIGYTGKELLRGFHGDTNKDTRLVTDYNAFTLFIDEIDITGFIRRKQLSKTMTREEVLRHVLQMMFDYIKTMLDDVKDAS